MPSDSYSRLTNRLADKVAAVGGSWRFIIGFGLFLAAWAVLNAGALVEHASAEPQADVSPA